MFVVATANDVSRLPPEFTRKGRFDETFFVGLPSSDERKAVWNVHLRRPRKAIPKFDVERLVTLSEGFTGAEIAEAVVTGMYLAFEDNYRAVSQSDMEQGLRESVPLSRSHAGLLSRLTIWGAHFAVPASRATTDGRR